MKLSMMNTLKNLKVAIGMNPKFVKFTENVGMYLNKEVPLNHFVNTGWD